MVIASLPYTVLTYKKFHWNTPLSDNKGNLYGIYLQKKHTKIEQIDANGLERNLQ